MLSGIGPQGKLPSSHHCSLYARRCNGCTRRRAWSGAQCAMELVCRKVLTCFSAARRRRALRDGTRISIADLSPFRRSLLRAFPVYMSCAMRRTRICGTSEVVIPR
jgi:hypothetical protein